MKVTIEFDSVEQAQAALAGINGGTPVVTMAQAAGHFPPPPVAQAAPAPMPVAPAPFVPPQAPAPAATPTAGASYTAADVQAAVQAYAKANNAKAAKALLNEFGVNSIAEIRPDQYAAVIARTQGA